VSRQLILDRIRQALSTSPAVPSPEIPRDYRRGPAPVDLDLFVERLVDYRAVVHRGSDISVIARQIVGDGLLVVPPGLPSEWLPAGQTRVDHGLSAADIAAADGVLTAAAVAIAETGTIVLDASPDQGRRILSLLPDLHICVLRPEQVVASVPEAVARLDPGRPLTWISGPSATSDIELNRVEGVHGPRNLHVVLWEAA
jgi:L-lactate dehydrogenase complex protein LldG